MNEWGPERDLIGSIYPKLRNPVNHEPLEKESTKRTRLPGLLMMPVFTVQSTHHKTIVNYLLEH